MVVVAGTRAWAPSSWELSSGATCVPRRRCCGPTDRSRRSVPGDSARPAALNDLATDAEVTRRSSRLRADARAEGGTLRATDLIENMLA